MPDHEREVLARIEAVMGILFPTGIPITCYSKLAGLLPGLLDLVQLSLETPEESPQKVKLRVLPVLPLATPSLLPPALKHDFVDALRDTEPSLVALAEREANAL